MRTPTLPQVEECRIKGPTNEPLGAFIVPIRVRHGKRKYRVIVANGQGWDHVSVSHPLETVPWEAMAAIKDLFFEDEEVVMQLHPAKSQYVNIHPNCLHLWRPQPKEEIERIRQAWGDQWIYGDLPSPGAIPLPPKLMV